MIYGYSQSSTWSWNEWRDYYSIGQRRSRSNRRLVIKSSFLRTIELILFASLTSFTTMIEIRISGDHISESRESIWACISYWSHFESWSSDRKTDAVVIIEHRNLTEVLVQENLAVKNVIVVMTEFYLSSTLGIDSRDSNMSPNLIQDQWYLTICVSYILTNFVKITDYLGIQQRDSFSVWDKKIERLHRAGDMAW